jgi:hypothetical protein
VVSSRCSLDARRAFTGPYSDDCRRHFSSAPRSHLLNTVVVRTRPQTERATDSAFGARRSRTERHHITRGPWTSLGVAPNAGRWRVPVGRPPLTLRGCCSSPATMVVLHLEGMRSGLRLSPGVLLARPDRLEGLLEVPVVAFEERVRGRLCRASARGWGVTGTRAGPGGRAAFRRCRRAEPCATRAARCRGRWHTAPRRARSGAWRGSPCPATRSESIAIMPRNG